MRSIAAAFSSIGLSVAVVVFAVAVPSLASGAGFGDCKQGGNGKHIFFPATKAPQLLEALKERKYFKARAKLLDQKVEIAEEKAALWKAQLGEAEKALKASSKALASEKKRAAAALVAVEKWRGRASKLEGERLWWFLGGVGAAILVVGGGIAVGWAVGR